MNKVIPNGLKFISPKIFKDNRGYFFESYNKDVFKQYGIDEDFVQDNESFSIVPGVMRGLHWQKPPFQQAKLVRVVSGAVIDFVLDIRRSSPTFGMTYFVYLSDYLKNQFFIPAGFAHGFLTLDNDTIFAYKCTNVYNKDSERGISILDPALNIINNLKKFMTKSLACQNDLSNIILSEKDKMHPLFANASDLFD